MLADQPMRHSVRLRWNRLPVDVQSALDCAFTTAIQTPQYVGHHFTHDKRMSGRVGEFHHFRIGYADFVVLLIPGYRAIIWDMMFDDADAPEPPPHQCPAAMRV